MSDLSTAQDNEILRIINGSQLYGTDTENSDTDWMGIFIEPKSAVFGSAIPHAKFRTQPEGVRSGPDDVDFITYSLRKFAYLAAEGNPSILTLLFAPEEAILYETYWGRQLLDGRDLFPSKKAGPRFLGYMQSQMKRLTGEKRGHVPSRPELIEAFGYDTKYAMHIARLGIQGIEYMDTGHITLPMSWQDRKFMGNIRSGGYTYEQILDHLEALEQSLKKAINQSDLPDNPDSDIWDWIGELHLDYWHFNRRARVLGPSLDLENA